MSQHLSSPLLAYSVHLSALREEEEEEEDHVGRCRGSLTLYTLATLPLLIDCYIRWTDRGMFKLLDSIIFIVDHIHSNILKIFQYIYTSTLYF